MTRKLAQITGSHYADENHRVLTVKGDKGRSFTHRREPCEQCPWRKDNSVGAFPAEAYRFSARTAIDIADSTFACHMSGADNSATCAGFLLKGADHSLSVRMAIMRGDYDPSQVRSDVELYEGYRSMAIANGVDPEDPSIKHCRGADEIQWRRKK